MCLRLAESFGEYILCLRCLKLFSKAYFANLMPAWFKAEPLVVFFIMHPILKPIGYFLFPVMFACPMTMLDPYPVDLCTYVEDRFDPDRWLLFRDSTHLYWGIVLILVTRSSIPSPGWLFYRVECSDCEDQHCPCLCIFFGQSDLTMKIYVAPVRWAERLTVNTSVALACVFFLYRMIWILNYTSSRTLIMNFHVSRVIFSDLEML